MNIKNFKNVNEAFEVISIDDIVLYTTVDPIGYWDMINMDTMERGGGVNGENCEKPYGVVIDLRKEATYNYEQFSYAFWFKTEDEQQECIKFFREYHNKEALKSKRTPSMIKCIAGWLENGLLSKEVWEQIIAPVQKREVKPQPVAEVA